MATPTNTARKFAATVTIAALVGMMVACSMPEDSMSPQEARDALIATITDSAALIEGPEWAETIATDAQECLAEGRQGAKYGYGYAAPPPDRDRLGDVEIVAEYWESLGMTVKIDEATGPVVYGSGGPVQNISFSSAPGNYYISGTSLCAPGDADALRNQENAR